MKMDNTQMDHANENHPAGGHGAYFYFDNQRAQILFEEWFPKTTGQMFGACFAVFFITVFWKFWQFLFAKVRVSQKYKVPNSDQKWQKLISWQLYLQAAMAAVHLGLCYMVMLISMTFNGWLFVSILLGAFVGWVAFEH